MICKPGYIIILFLLLCPPAKGQETSSDKVYLNGYLSFMESALYLEGNSGDMIWGSLLHNRLNLFCYPSPKITFSVQARNRIISGGLLKNDEFDIYKNTIAGDPGIFDMSVNIAAGGSYVLNASIDRLWIGYSAGKFEITAGRQRINWGQTYAWNPNDLFNNFSFYDFDYIERPGSDAIRIRYYTGDLSVLEAVAKADSAGDVTAAGLFRTHAGKYDIQVIGGLLAGSDAVIGTGWAGGIGQAGFRGEVSYLRPVENFIDTTGIFLASIAFDYTFPNSFMLTTEAFFNQKPEGNIAGSFNDFYSEPLSVKYLSFTEYNLLLQAAYPVTPLINTSMAAVYFPKADGFYLGPSVTFSLGNNLEMALYLQYFNGRFSGAADSGKQSYIMGFGRLKWNF